MKRPIPLIYVSGSVYKNQTIKLAGILVNYTISRTNSSEGIQFEYLPPKYYNALFKDDWQSVDAELIASLIIIYSLSNINGYYAETEFEIQDNIKSVNRREIVRPPKISDDHIYIDGVGWMNEDEVRKDR